MASCIGFRVVCDLSDFFTDIRRKVLIYVDPSKDRCVADLVARVKTLTGLFKHPNIVLAIGDCLLSMTEDIRILHQEDVLKVTIADTFTPVLEAVNENHQDVHKRKRKDKSRKKSKKKTSESESLQYEESVIENEVEVDVKSSVTDAVDLIPSVTNADNFSCSKPTVTLDDNLGETEPSVKKRRRMRVRRRRKPAEKGNIDYSADISVDNLKTRLANVAKPVFSYSHSNQKHIRFSDTSENKSLEEKYFETHGVSHKLLAGPGREPQNEVGASTPFENNVQSQPKATQWDIKQHPTLTQETMENGNKSEGTNHNMFSKLLALANSTPLVVKHSRAPIAEVKPVPDIATTPLQGFPKNGDILTFKIWRMDENYCPQISNLITAKVLLYSDATEQVSVEILDGRDQCQQPKGKFNIESDEEEIEKQDSSIIQLNWKEIIEPCRNVF